MPDNPKRWRQVTTRRCGVCGELYHPFRASQLFCSRKCAAVGRVGKTKRTSAIPNVKCTTCGRALFRKGYQVNKRENFFCNRECKGEFDRDKYRSNPNFKGQRKPCIGVKIRTQRKGKKWRRDIFKRDSYCCNLCGTVRDIKDLEADHIYPLWRIIREFNITTMDEANSLPCLWDVKNGRTLCVDCHRKVKYEGDLRMPGTTPTQRTLEYAKNQGWKADVVERWIRNPKHPAGGFRKDFMNFVDIIAMGEGRITAIQSCGQAYSEHNKKITEDPVVAPLALKWLQCGGYLMLIGWRKVKLKKGGKAMRWEPRIKEYFISDFESDHAQDMGIGAGRAKQPNVAIQTAVGVESGTGG